MKRRTVLGTGVLSVGSASFVTSTLKAGTTTVTAVYGGDTGTHKYEPIFVFKKR